MTQKEIAWIVHDYILDRSFTIYKLGTSQTSQFYLSIGLR